jgi:hypothetical protein
VGETVREATAGVRDAAHDLGDGARAWAACVRDAAMGGGAVDPLEECGTPPDPAEYGLPPSAEEIEHMVQDVAAATGADADALRAWVACLRDGPPPEPGDPIRLDPGRCGPPPIPTPVGVTVPTPGEPPAAPPVPDASSLVPPTVAPVATPPPVTVTVPPDAAEDLLGQVEELARSAHDGFLPPPRFDR